MQWNTMVRYYKLKNADEKNILSKYLLTYYVELYTSIPGNINGIKEFFQNVGYIILLKSIKYLFASVFVNPMSYKCCKNVLDSIKVIIVGQQLISFLVITLLSSLS